MKSDFAREMVVFDTTDWSEAHRREFTQRADALATEITTVGESPSDDAHGWNIDSVATLINRLSVGRGVVQAKTFRAAVENGGYVSRNEVYKLGEFDAETRSLKGFTRPVARVVLGMKDAGELPLDAVSPFETDYDPNARGFQPARGFRVPGGIVEIYRSA